MSKYQAFARFLTLWDSGPLRVIANKSPGPKLSLIMSSFMSSVSLVRASRKEERRGIIPSFYSYIEIRMPT